LRKILLARVEQASNQLKQQIEAQVGKNPDQLMKETTRIFISAAAYAISFGYMAGVLPPGKRRGLGALGPKSPSKPPRPRPKA
jgi:hypothetical protein